METDQRDEVDSDTIRDVIRLLKLALDDCYKMLDAAEQRHILSDCEEGSKEGP